MGVFDETDATIMANAFKKALTDYGVAKTGESTSTTEKIEPQTSDVVNNINTETRIEPTTDVSANQKNSSQIQKEISAFTTAMTIPAKSVEIYDKSLDSLSRAVNPVLDQYNEIQAAYGGLNVDLDKAVGSSKAVIDRLQSMQNQFYNVGKAGTEMSEKLGFSSNIVNKYFKDEAEAFNESEQVLGALVDQHSQYVNQLDEETLTKLPFYKKALGISSRAVAESVERSINSTGKAQTTMLDDIAMFAQGLEKTTGIPLKAIAQNAVQISNDTQRLGDVTAEEATRIAATLGQLGQTYDSFTGALDKFQEFGSSAETSGLISQITGGAVNLDAQHLMYLASEEQEKFLPELRRSLLGGGFTKEVFEGMAQAEQRQFASTLSMDREQVRSLLDTSREFSEADLINQQADIAASKTDGFKAVVDQMELAPKYADDSTKSMDHLRTAALIPLQQDLLIAADEYSKLNANIRDNIELTDQASVSDGLGASIRAQGDAAATIAGKINEPVKIGVKELGNILSTEAEALAAKQSPAQNLNQNNSVTVNPDQTSEDSKKIIAKLEEVQTTNIENTTANNTNNESTNKQLADLTAALSAYNENTTSNKEIILMVDKSELGRILIDGEFIVNGAPTKLVRTV